MTENLNRPERMDRNMENIKIQVRFKMSSDAMDLKPAKAHADDAAFDLRSRADLTVQPGKVTLAPTGLFLELPVGYEAQIRPRSGMALKYSMTLLNTPGTIDAGYRGEVCCIMFNAGDQPYEVKRGDRIAQMVIAALPDVELTETAELSESERAAGGFGSTGKQ